MEKTTDLSHVTDKTLSQNGLGSSSKFILYLYTFIISFEFKTPGGQKLTYAMLICSTNLLNHMGDTCRSHIINLC
jgi:hypothetical protein